LPRDRSFRYSFTSASLIESYHATHVYVHLVDAEVRAEYQEAFGEYRPEGRNE